MVHVGVPWNRHPQSAGANAIPRFTVQQAVLVGVPEEDEVDVRRANHSTRTSTLNLKAETCVWTTQADVNSSTEVPASYSQNQ